MYVCIYVSMYVYVCMYLSKYKNMLHKFIVTCTPMPTIDSAYSE